MSTATDRRIRRSLNHRVLTALDRGRGGDLVVMVVEKYEHIGHMLSELERGAQEGDIVQRASGQQGMRFRDGGRITFRAATNPDSIRGLSGVDIFLVDPRVATTSALEQAMQIACFDADEATATIVRPGDQP